MASAKIQKTIARQQEKYIFPQLPMPISFTPALTRSHPFPRISEGQYYEAHQQLRVIASRYVKSENWDAAIDLLYGGALALLKAGQGGSGGDLGIFLIEVLGKGGKGMGVGEKSMPFSSSSMLTILWCLCWQCGSWSRLLGCLKMKEKAQGYVLMFVCEYR